MIQARLSLCNSLMRIIMGNRIHLDRSYSPYSLRCLHRWELHSHHTVRVGFTDQVGFGTQDVWGGHGGHTVLQTPSTVATICQEEGVLCLWLKTRD